MNLIEFGKRIRKQRVSLDLRATGVATAVGITPAYLSMLESGRNPKTKKPSKPSFGVLLMFAHVLQLDLNELAELSGHSSTLIKLSQDIEQTSSWDQARTIAVIMEKIERLQSEIGEIKNLILQLRIARSNYSF